MADEKVVGPTGDMVTTFTLAGKLYGVDQDGKIWRRAPGGLSWAAVGEIAKEEVKP